MADLSDFTSLHVGGPARDFVEVATEAEIIDGLTDKGIKRVTYKKINEGQSLAKIELDKPVEYWRWMLIIGLLFLLSEWAVLKFWK